MIDGEQRNITKCCIWSHHSFQSSRARRTFNTKLLEKIAVALMIKPNSSKFELRTSMLTWRVRGFFSHAPELHLNWSILARLKMLGQEGYRKFHWSKWVFEVNGFCNLQLWAEENLSSDIPRRKLKLASRWEEMSDEESCKLCHQK